MRLFVAIPLDVETRERVVAEQQRLIDALGIEPSSFRRATPRQLHITLAFIGQVAADRGAAIAATFAARLSHPPFELTLGGAGVFPARGSPRVLWLGVGHGGEQVTAVRDLVVARLAAAGVTIDEPRFSPHLTLGRWRAGSRIRPAARHVSGPVVARLEVREVILYQSHLSVTGSTYTAMTRTPLCR